MSPPSNSCPRCKATFRCNPENILSCQCNIPLQAGTLTFLQKTKYDCLCASCLKELDLLVDKVSKSENIHTATYEEGLHYYIENGRWVFTEYYHILRGYCCQSGCRHCGYGFHMGKN